MNSALIVVDIQNDYFPNGSNPLVGASEALEKALKIVDHFRSKNLPVFFIQHFNSAESAFFRPATVGAEIHSDLAPKATEKIVQKNYPNSFKNTTLLADLQAIDSKHLVFVGMMSHMCIDATVRAAKDFDFNCTVVHDACASKDLILPSSKIVPAAQVHYSFMAALNGYYAEVVDASNWLNNNN